MKGLGFVRPFVEGIVAAGVGDAGRVGVAFTSGELVIAYSDSCKPTIMLIDD